MLITAERDGYFGLRAKPALGNLFLSGSCQYYHDTTRNSRVTICQHIETRITLGSWQVIGVGL